MVPKLGAEMAYGAGISAAGGTAGGEPCAQLSIVLERQNRNDQHESEGRPRCSPEIEAGSKHATLSGSMNRETAHVARQNQV
jgi:hypothetical protein